MIVERQRKLKAREPPRCAGGVSFWMLKRVGLRVPERVVAAKIRRVRIYSPNMKFWELRGTEEYGYVLHRNLFDEWLRERAQGLGATLWWTDETENLVKRFKYDYLVGADGYPSVVRDWVGRPKLTPCDVHLGVQKTVVWKGHPKDLIELYFGGKVAHKGYAWIFPGGDGKARVGLGVPLSERINPGKLLETFMMRVGAHSCEELHYIAKLIPTAKFPRIGVYGNVLLVGDALPSTDPLTGGGICQAIASGEAAGRAIAEGKPERYNHYISWLRQQNMQRYWLKRVLYSLKDEDFNQLIQTLQGFRPKTLSVSGELRRGIRHLTLRKTGFLIKILKAFISLFRNG
jgi:digeranylgeranylglycerophospholipid reductase